MWYFSLLKVMRHIGNAVRNIYKKVCYKGSSDKFTNILFAWHRIVRGRLSKNTWPQKILPLATNSTVLLSLYIMVKTSEDRKKIILMQDKIKDKIKIYCECSIDNIIVHDVTLEHKNIR